MADIFNTNGEPYFDDFDDSKNFMQVLFKPGVPVQVRELNQLQSILHNQQTKFSDHIFKHGSLINGQNAERMYTRYVTIDPISPFTGVDIDDDRISYGIKFIGDTSGVEARLILYVSATDTDPATAYFNYTRAGVDFETIDFIPGETVNVVDGNDQITYSFKVRCTECPNSTYDETYPSSGTGVLWRIPEGIYYAFGYFLEADSNTIVGEKYDYDKTSYDVGFIVVSDIVTAEDDESLYDNTLGYPNESAAGADRARIQLIPTIRDTGPNEDDRFIKLATVIKGTLQYIKNKTEYADIMDMLAERTYDESGNYTVTPFKLSTREHLSRVAGDGGLYTSDEGGDENYYIATLSPGKAYVRGYQFETISSYQVEMEKARESLKQRRFFNNFRGMSYVLVHVEPNSLFMPTDTALQGIYAGLDVDLHSGHTSGGIATGSIIGHLKAYDVQLDRTLSDDYRVVSADVTSGGTGYTTATVSFSNPAAGGTQAQGTAVIIGGVITSITITNSGTGYTSTPTITITGNGTGASATAKTKNYGGKIYRLYFVNMTMESGYSYDSVKSMKRTGTITFNASTHPDDSTDRPKIYNNDQSTMIWNIADYVKSTRDVDNPDIRSISYSSRERFQAILDSSGSYQWIAPAGEYFTSLNSATSLAAVINTGTNAVTILDNISTFIVVTPEKLKVNLTSTYAGYRFILFHNVMKSNVIEKKKSIIATTEVEKGISLSTGLIELSNSDLYKMIKIEKYDITSPSNKIECTDEFTWIDGQTEYGYVPVTLTPINPSLYGVNDRFDVYYQYYQHGPGDFFSIDSYQDIIDDESIDYQYGDVPSFKAKNGVVYNLRDCLDFRPLILNSNPLDVDQPTIEGQFSMDLERYLPRIDLLVVTRYGEVYQKRGISDRNPVPPKVEPDGSEMALYEIHMDPYVLDLEKNARFKFIDNKRYTMRDIGRLESRLKQVEYYTTFSLAELALSQTSVVDEFGFNRFKNGFAAENFQNFQFTDTNSSEFRSAIDSTDKTLRPEYTMDHTGFEFDPDNSTNCKQIGDLVLLDYNEEYWLSQDLASKTISVNPYFIFNKIGKIVMDPAYDNWTDINKKPDITVNATTPAVDGNINLIGKTWGTWSSVNVTGVNLGDRITDISLKTYMRSIPVKFYASGMKSNIQVYPFFDDIDVSQHCRPLVADSQYGDALVTDETGNLSGEFLIPSNTFFVGQKTFSLSNDPGNSDDADLLFTSAEGIFWSGGLDLERQSSTLNVITPITPPPPNPSTKQVEKITTTTAGSIDPCNKPKAQGCLSTSTAAAGYYGIPSPYTRTGGIKPSGSGQNSRANISQLWSDGFKATGYKIGRSGTLADKFINWLVKNYYGVTCNVPNQTWCNPNHVDPVAQSFSVEDSCFITAVDVYFSSVASGEKAFCQIVKMQNGYPTKTILGEARLDEDQISVSNDASVATNFKFPFPIFVEGDNEYAIVVGGESPDTRIWISQLGGVDIASNITIETQPSLGSFFKSQNSSTWSASQYEDMKFQIYRARFIETEMELVMVNTPKIDEQFYNNPFETESGSTRVRIHQKNHGVAVGDKIQPRIGENTWIELTEDDGTICVGNTITTATGSAVVRKVVQNGATREVYLQNIKGTFTSGQIFTTDNITISGNEYIQEILNMEVAETTSGIITGVINTNFNFNLNGIPLYEFNYNDLEVIEVDSAESFIVEVTTPATTTGFTGGDVILDTNKQYEAMSFTGNYLTYDSLESWAFVGVGHETNGLFSANNYVYLDPINVQPNQVTQFEQPMKIINGVNTNENFDGNPYMKVVGVFYTTNNLISPVINVKSFSSISIHNVVDYNVQEDYEVSPNATDRLIEETDPIEGVSLFKWVSQEMVLTNPATDVRIYVDVCKPQDTDFDIYVKARDPSDVTDIDDLPWIKVENIWKSFTSLNSSEYREVEVELGENNPSTFDGTFEFDMLKFKLVGKAKNPATPPTFKFLRIIAVT